MIGLDADTLLRAMTGCTLARAQVWAPHLDAAMGLADINSPKRAADFIAQLGHESGGLLYANELWGPTVAQIRYERDFTQPWNKGNARNSLAFTLGNTEAGDGRRFAGHGPIQTTGRYNHAKVRDELRALGMDAPDFEAEPGRLGEPRWGALSAAMFWKRKNLNKYADNGDFVEQTRLINGGRNGLADRLTRRVRARQVLGL